MGWKEQLQTEACFRKKSQQGFVSVRKTKNDKTKMVTLIIPDFIPPNKMINEQLFKNKTPL